MFSIIKTSGKGAVRSESSIMGNSSESNLKQTRYAQMSDSKQNMELSGGAATSAGATTSPAATPGGELMQGTVKWFNDAKGFGFIEHDSGRDVFVHYSVIETEGFKTLKDGEVVFYSLAEGDKGLHAARVVRDPSVVKTTAKQKGAAASPAIAAAAA